jgi:endonuclease YncB( thermonuclease family)
VRGFGFEGWLVKMGMRLKVRLKVGVWRKDQGGRISVRVWFTFRVGVRTRAGLQ